ncbi:hypothetical protein HRbin28_00153 [bacterium HR28]|nr:hypothetical protein HRbin28_00153 [bacterium HR28]
MSGQPPERGQGWGGGPVGEGLRVVPADEFLGRGGIATTRLRRCLLSLSRSRRAGSEWQPAEKEFPGEGAAAASRATHAS